MSTPAPPSPIPEIDLRRHDTEIVVAVFRTIFLLVILAFSQFLQAPGGGGFLLQAAVIAAALYNLCLFIMHVRGYAFPRLIIVLVDVVFISLWVFFCKWPAASSFFTLYFAVVIVAGLWYGMGGAFVTAVFASILYVWAVWVSRPVLGPPAGVTVAIQVTFLIATAGVLSIAIHAQDRERQALAASRAVLQRYRERIRVAQFVDDLVRPKRLPAAPGLDLGFQYRPAAMAFSGDYYDLIPLGGRRWGLCIADLSGHFSQHIGYLSTFKTALRLTARREQSPARVLTEINREVAAAFADNVELETFISMAYIVVDLDEATFTYANAGHEPPVMAPAEGGEPLALAQAGIVLGVGPEARYPEQTLPLHTGDTLVLFSDGMTEVADREGRLLGREDFLALVHERLQAPTAEEIAARIFDDVNRYGREGQHRDDMTLLIARITATDLGQSSQFVPT
jgi:serine phosphatase RsbU (regulator of sigma subunit)